MSNRYEILKQFRTIEEVQADWELEQHRNGDCGGDCHLCRTLCACGHDLEDEHRLIEARVYDGIIVSRICDICDVDCHVLIGEKEAYEAKCREINAKALPKVEAEVRKYLKGAK